MKKTILLILMMYAAWSVGQDTGAITLDSCLKGAVENYPNYRQLDLNSEVMKLNLQNINAYYYPTLNLVANASYQSDVTQISMPVPGFESPAIPKDWYAINLNVEQMIYDGGLTTNQKKVEESNTEINDQKVAVGVYQLKEKVNQLFFKIIYLNQSLAILDLLTKNLTVQINDAEVGFQNGVLLQADVDVLKVEMYNASQQITSLEEEISGLLGSLSELTGFSVQSAAQLETPQIEITQYLFENNRPEYLLFSLQQNQLSDIKSLREVRRRPVLAAYGQAGYGRPGYDMLNTEFDTYYKVEARFFWNIWDWGKIRREKQVIDLQSEIINTQKETFNQELKASLFQRIAEINKYEKLIENDQLIADLQTNVVNTADFQLKDGAITSTNYVIELNKLVKAQLNLEAHKLQLVFAKYQYITATGNL